jgi:ATP-dependent Lon protease
VKYFYRSESYSIPQRLYFISLRETVLFPNVVAPLFLPSDEALIVLNRIILENGLIGCVGQRDPYLKDPQPKDLLSVGTVCKIVQLVRLPEKGAKILVEGLSRVSLQNISREFPYFKADVKPIDEHKEKTVLSETLVQSIGTLFRISLSQGRPFSEEMVKALDKIDHPGRLADLIAITLRLAVKDQQDVFETVDPLERLKKVFHYFSRELQVSPFRPTPLVHPSREGSKALKDHACRPQRVQKEGPEEDLYQAEIRELREKVHAAGMPQKVEEIADKEIYRLERMNPISAEYTVSRTYLDYLVTIPWKKKTPDNLDLDRAGRILNEDHYGLEKVKERILEFLAVKKLKDPMKGPILCFVGPPGVGKTSLGRSIARALERKFIRISLGGVRDEAEIRGHRRTYVGALPGRIIQEIRRAETSNPVFMLDEVDKMGQDLRGDPASALLEALDPEQNFSFTDHYLDVPFDLSHVMFITTANTLSPVPPALIDRMEVIQLSGYTEEEKEKIAFQFLIPHQKEENGLKEYPLGFTSEAVSKVIRQYTREAGVRNLEREIGGLCRKIAKEVALGNVERKTIDEKGVEALLGPKKHFREVTQEKDRVGVATGLAWTENGGDILFIETSKMKGDKGLILTGSLGEVMKESAQTALSYIRSNADSLHLPENFHEQWDLHIHIPAGATPKDGPSAGASIGVAVVSLLKGIPLPRRTAMTGEMTLSGRILPVGGIKEKLLAARRAGVESVILPKKNEENLADIPDEVRREMNLILVEEFIDILHLLHLTEDPALN